MSLEKYLSRVEARGVNPPVNIDILKQIKIYYCEPTISIHKKKVKDRVYEWVVKRISLPKEFPDNKLVYCLAEEDFMKLVDFIHGLLRKIYKKQ